MKLSIHISSDNEAASTIDDVRAMILGVVDRLADLESEEGGLGTGGAAGIIRDVNGNRVGNWTVTP